MDYFDDLLNVFGYLRKMSRTAAENLNTAIRWEIKAGAQYDAISEQLDHVTRMLRETAEACGISADVESPPEAAPGAEAENVLKKIVLPGDMDYEREFQELVRKAREAGFTDVHPEDLLTAEEMAFAEEYSQELDLQFAAATGLTPQDMSVAAIGICLHILRIYLPKAKGLSVVERIHGQAVVDGLDGAAGGGFKTAQDLLGVVKELDGIIPNKNYIQIKTPAQILEDPPSFQCVFDERYPEKSSILGYDPLLGWLFGVYNILTDTVTFSDMRTFLPEPMTEKDYLTLARDYLPLRDIMVPFAMEGLSGKRDEVIAGVIREAYALIPEEIDFASVAQHYEYCKNLTSMASQGVGVIDTVRPLEGIDQIFSQAGWASVINTILIAIHGLFRGNERDMKKYMIRSMKVVTMANFIGSAVGSLHVLVDHNYLNADWGGLAASLIETVHMTRFWVDVKAEFLVSAYLPELQKRLNELDQYI